ncbi:hypothetical protein J2X76_005508 [Neorhizobium sp. 2083]|uniref:hypothetical protein n=1 Tax=Neorhizobium sp. 2083 TaxID=2817762 RepID=UPI002865F5CA|nr:hypothetical protein [Neorhizobium sp. 2083]MDR6820311.1 hypothetical protein [Neorhizobium sp. 2083]
MPVETLLVLHILLSLIYFASLGLRFAAFTRQQFAGPGPAAPRPPEDGLPCYTVMVALYREAAVAEQLIASLVRLDWPPSLLDIKLICDADDQETIAALKAPKPARHFEIVEEANLPCPPELPAEVLGSFDSASFIGKRSEHIDSPSKSDDDALRQDVVDNPHLTFVRSSAGHDVLRKPARARSSPSRRAVGDTIHIRREWISATPAYQKSTEIIRVASSFPKPLQWDDEDK